MKNKTLDMLQRIAGGESFVEDCSKEDSDLIKELRDAGLVKAIDGRSSQGNSWDDVKLTLKGDEELARTLKIDSVFSSNVRNSFVESMLSANKLQNTIKTLGTAAKGTQMSTIGNAADEIKSLKTNTRIVETIPPNNHREQSMKAARMAEDVRIEPLIMLGEKFDSLFDVIKQTSEIQRQSYEGQVDMAAEQKKTSGDSYQLAVRNHKLAVKDNKLTWVIILISVFGLLANIMIGVFGYMQSRSNKESNVALINAINCLSDQIQGINTNEVLKETSLTNVLPEAGTSIDELNVNTNNLEVKGGYLNEEN